MGYIKFDTDWMNDAKICAYRTLYGKAALVDVVNLYCAWGESENGVICVKNEEEFALLRTFLGKRSKGTFQFLDRCAKVGIIEREAYEKLGLVGCRRSIHDAEARARRRISAKDASDAAREKRLQKRLEDGG